jgi:hypothetical protein
MKKHQLLTLGAWTLALSFAAGAALADKPAGDRPPHAKDGKPEGKPGDHLGKPDKDGMGPKGEHGKPEADGTGGKPGDGARPHAHGDGFRNAMSELREEMKAGKLTKEELKAKLAALHESAGDRGKAHRQELSKRWGGTLANPSAVEELKHHARRMAFLNRAMLLAQTEVKQDKDKLTDRISKLIDKENARHEQAMARLQAAPAPAAAAAAASAAPAAAPAASAASDEKGAEK